MSEIVEIITWIGVGVGTAVGGFVSGMGANKVRIRRSNSQTVSTGGCPDPNCQSDVRSVKQDVEALKKAQNDEIFPRLNKVHGHVKYISGRIDQQWGQSDLLRKQLLEEIGD